MAGPIVVQRSGVLGDSLVSFGDLTPTATLKCSRWLVGMATTIFERVGSRIPSSRFQRPSHARTTLHAHGRSADMPLSCINDELLKQFDLSPCVSLGLRRMLASPLPPIALAPVRPDRFGACRPSKAARQGWWRDHRRLG